MTVVLTEAGNGQCITSLPNVYVSSGLKPRYDMYPLIPALRLGLVTVLYKLGFSPDSACTETVEVPDLRSVGQVQTTRRVVSTSCSDYLLSIPNVRIFYL